jgi:hypothetical protein
MPSADIRCIGSIGVRSVVVGNLPFLQGALLASRAWGKKRRPSADVGTNTKIAFAGEFHGADIGSKNVWANSGDCR